MLDFSAAEATMIGRILANGIDSYEPEVVALVKALLSQWTDKRNVFIDIGANIGFFPLVMGKYAADNKISLDSFAHEPYPYLARIAMKLQQANNIFYELLPSAASDFCGEAEFYISAKSDSSNSLVKDFRKAKTKITVDVVTLDSQYYDLLHENGYDNILIMMDTECSEPSVMRGAEKILLTFRPLIISEVLYNRTEIDLISILNKINYSIFSFNGQKWTLQDTLIGDKTFTYRDFLFCPKEKESEYASFFSR